MPRSKTVVQNFETTLLVADQVTAGGRIYPKALLKKIAAQINQKPITIEELSPVERKAKGKPVCYSWPEHAMAVSNGAIVEGNELKVSFGMFANKYGKLLQSTADSANGISNVTFMPVGIGDVDENNVVSDTYELQYITIKPKD